MYSVEFTDTAEESLLKLPPDISKRIVLKLESLADDPFRVAERLTNSTYYKIRMGKYRVIVDISCNHRNILVIAVDNRKRVYKNHF